MVRLARRSAEPEPPVVDVEHVPTADELVGMGLATREPKGIGIKPEGHALIGEIMRRNGRAAAAAEAVRPPIVKRPPMTPEQQAAAWAREAFAE